MMTVPPHGQELSGREEALAREVTMLLEPVLLELDRKLDSILQNMDDLLTKLDVDSIHTLLARLEAGPGAVQRDGAPELRVWLLQLHVAVGDLVGIDGCNSEARPGCGDASEGDLVCALYSS